MHAISSIDSVVGKDPSFVSMSHAVAVKGAKAGNSGKHQGKSKGHDKNTGTLIGQEGAKGQAKGASKSSSATKAMDGSSSREAPSSNGNLTAKEKIQRLRAIADALGAQQYDNDKLRGKSAHKSENLQALSKAEVEEALAWSKKLLVTTVTDATWSMQLDAARKREDEQAHLAQQQKKRRGGQGASAVEAGTSTPAQLPDSSTSIALHPKRPVYPAKRRVLPVLELCCGAGGLSFLAQWGNVGGKVHADGSVHGGMEVAMVAKYACDIDRAACNAYSINHPEAHVRMLGHGVRKCMQACARVHCSDVIPLAVIPWDALTTWLGGIIRAEQSAPALCALCHFVSQGAESMLTCKRQALLYVRLRKKESTDSYFHPFYSCDQRGSLRMQARPRASITQDQQWQINSGKSFGEIDCMHG